MNLKEEIEKIVAETVVSPHIVKETTVFTTSILTTESGKKYFLKTGPVCSAYRCEANGLRELANVNGVNVPIVAGFGTNFLLTEYISTTSPGSRFFSKLGETLALIHKYKGKYFGFYEDNYIGTSPQINSANERESHNWCEFYFNKRLLFQYRMAEKNGLATGVIRDGMVKIERNIHTIIPESDELPSLLHGDLWCGNYMCNENRDPVLIDPAVYYGNRESDLAMTHQFGGFPGEFYISYSSEYPLLPGWEFRENIYKLYHILNHLNIFGRGYLYQAEQIINYYICRAY